MYINVSKPKNMRFNVNIQGVDYKQLQGSVKFVLEGIEYGFPVEILRDHMAVDVPPLDEIIKKGLVDGETIECQLDVFGEGFYMKPWKGNFELKRNATIEAHMVYGNDSSTETTNKPRIVVEENIDNGNETSQLMKLLEKLVSERMKISDGTTMNAEEIVEPDNDDSQEIKAVSSLPKDNNDIDLEKGIMGKRGKRSIVVEPPKSVKEKRENKKAKSIDSLVDSFLEKSNLTNISKKKRLAIESKLKQKLQKKKYVNRIKETKKFKPKQIGEQVTKQDLSLLFESVGMTKLESQKRIIGVAKNMGNDDIGDIYHAVKRILFPEKTKSPYDEFLKIPSD